MDLATHAYPAFQRYVSVLDVDQSVLKAPLYKKGEFVDELLALRKQWPDEETYLAWIYYKVLSLCFFVYRTIIMRYRPRHVF
jgi:hypothetical protein